MEYGPKKQERQHEIEVVRSTGLYRNHLRAAELANVGLEEVFPLCLLALGQYFISTMGPSKLYPDECLGVSYAFQYPYLLDDQVAYVVSVLGVELYYKVILTEYGWSSVTSECP